MARTPNKKTTPIEDPVAAEALEVMETSHQTASTLQAEHSEERDLVNQLLGQVQMANSFARFADVVSLTKLKHIKETKMYRALAGKQGVDQNGNKIADIGTFDGFCQALGLSRSKVDEDLTNLNVFGEQALNQLTALGVGYREMRQYRRLPEDQKTALIEAAQSGDKESFVDLAEEFISKNAKEKAELQQQLEDSRAENEAKEEVAATNRRKIDELQEELIKVKRLPPDECAAQMRTEANKYVDEVDDLIRVQLTDALTAIQNYSLEHGIDPMDYLETRVTLLDKSLAYLRTQIDFVRMDEFETPIWETEGE